MTYFEKYLRTVASALAQENHYTPCEILFIFFSSDNEWQQTTTSGHTFEEGLLN